VPIRGRITAGIDQCTECKLERAACIGPVTGTMFCKSSSGRHQEKVIAKQRPYHAKSPEKMKEKNFWYYRIQKEKAEVTVREKGVCGVRGADRD